MVEKVSSSSGVAHLVVPQVGLRPHQEQRRVGLDLLHRREPVEANVVVGIDVDDGEAKNENLGLEVDEPLHGAVRIGVGVLQAVRDRGRTLLHRTQSRRARILPALIAVTM